MQNYNQLNRTRFFEPLTREQRKLLHIEKAREILARADDPRLRLLAHELIVREMLAGPVDGDNI